MNAFRFTVCLGLFAISFVSVAHAQESLPTKIDFNRQIRPLLSDACYTCHGPDEQVREAELRLDTEEGAFGKANDIRVITPGEPNKSELLLRIISDDEDMRMPPADAERQLTKEEIELIRGWIEQGAKWSNHWSLVAPQSPPLPHVKKSDWPRSKLDHFVLARLEKAGLTASPEASKETLIRRATLDLTGLPPTLEEIDNFLADDSPGAYEKVIDRLFRSPRYGERMVLPWLDAARYSDTNGYQTDGTRAMWPWRDWVIKALNDNMPFDQFTIEQIAGDMLPNATLDQKIASGFNRNNMLNGEGGRIPEESRVNYVIDRLETTGAVWLGLTVGCSRCHDHKYDPFTQKEFYSVFAYYNSIDETGSVDRRSSTAAPTIELPTDKQTARKSELQKTISDQSKQQKKLREKLLATQAQWEETASAKLQDQSAEIAALLKVAADQRSDAQKKKLTDLYLAAQPELQELKKKEEAAKKERGQINRSILITMVMKERQQPRETFVLIRGEYDKHGEKVSAGVPSALHPLPEGQPNNRLGFAHWLIDRANPLTARVTVNRYWQLFFGVGLVKTTEDFGSQGDAPSHPQLLDHLAVEFMKNWDVKAMHKQIVMSATYRQASKADARLLEIDPANELLSRGPRFRLSSHAIRDQALFLSGLMTEKLGGPPVKPYQPAGIWDDFSLGKIKYVQDHGEDLYRRTLYTFWRRSVGPTMLFDVSARQVCSVKQLRTNTPLHALTLMNDITYVETARSLAQRMMIHGGKTPAERIEWAFRLATSRLPSEAEKKVLVGGYQRTLASYQKDPEAAKKLISTGEASRDEALDPVEHAAYTGVASVLLNLDEVITKE